MFSRLAIFVSALALLGACSPKDEQLSVTPPPVPTKQLPQVDVSRFHERTGELSRHLLSQLANARLILERAYTERISDRIQTALNGRVALDNGGFRTLYPLGPSRDRAYPMSVESFRIRHNVRDVSKPMTWAELSGSELYDVHWSAPFPTSSSEDPGYPTHIRMIPNGLMVNVLIHTPERQAQDNIVRIFPRGDVAIAFAGEDLTTLSYTVTSDITNDFDYQVQGVRRVGGIRMQVDEVVMKVSKETKKVISIESGSLLLQVTDRNLSDAPPQPLAVDPNAVKDTVVASVDFSLDRRMKLGSDPCKMGSGTFSGHKAVGTATQTLDVTSSEGKLVVELGGNKTEFAHEICRPTVDEDKEILKAVFHEEYQSIYF